MSTNTEKISQGYCSDCGNRIDVILWGNCRDSDECNFSDPDA